MMRTLAVGLLAVFACAPADEQSATSSDDEASHYLVVGTDSIYYEVEGDGPAIVLIHGGFGDRRMWDAQVADLATDYRVVRYDHRGFGNSSRPDSAYSAVDDLRQLMDHLGIQKAHIIGNSLGGGTALDFAALHPERVEKVVAVASGANGYPYDERDFAGMTAVFAAGKAQGADTAAAMWLRDPMIGISSRHPRTAALVRQMVRENGDIFTMEHWPWETHAPTTYERLGQLTMPVLLIIGEKDTRLVQRVADATAARLPNAETFLVPDADHLPQMLEPEVFNARVRAFLGR
jgi:3-oxoadipate enol-lactonase